MSAALPATAAPRMTRTYAARRLLEHGPLTARELLAITRWPSGTVKTIVERLTQRGVIEPRNLPGCHRRAYALAHKFFPANQPETTTP